MKTALIIYEGMADRPVSLLENRTPMETARCVAATEWAVTGRGGLIQPARQEARQRPECVLAQYAGLTPTAADAVWRGPLEALAAAVPATKGDWVYRADFVTLDGERLSEADVQCLSMQETERLAAAVQERFASNELTLTAVRPGQVAVVVHKPIHDGAHGVSPFAIEGEDIQIGWARVRHHGFIQRFVETAGAALRDHPINEVRVDLGENPANGLWPWGGGPSSQAAERAGGPIMATDNLMARGLAIHLGMNIVEMINPWSDKAGKRAPFRIAKLVEALRGQDRLIVYASAPRKGGRCGLATDKVWALEALDQAVLAPTGTLLDAWRPYRVALCVDGAVSAETGRPLTQPLPVIVSGAGIEPDGVGHWDEQACATGALGACSIAEVLSALNKE